MTMPTIPTTTARVANGQTVSNEIRARHACRQLEEWGIHEATPAYDPATGGYNGRIAVDPHELFNALNTASEDEW